MQSVLQDLRGGLTVKETASRAEYLSVSAFSHAFRDRFDTTPAAWAQAEIAKIEASEKPRPRART